MKGLLAVGASRWIMAASFIVALRCLAVCAGEPENVLHRAPREAEMKLQDARRAVAQEDYAQALACLEKLLSAEVEDGFIAAGQGCDAYRPLKAEATAMLATFPPKGLETYEISCGSAARGHLAVAVANRDRLAVANVASRYPFTRAGDEAAMLLGYDALSRAQPWEALAWTNRLAQSPRIGDEFVPAGTLVAATAWLSVGRPDLAAEALGRLKRLDPRVGFCIGNEKLRCGDEPARIMACLERSLGSNAKRQPPAPESWLLFRGDAARNAASAWTGTVGALRWAARTQTPATARDLEEAQAAVSGAWRGAGLSAAHPLVVDRFVLARTPLGLAAIDPVTGRRIWEYPRDTTAASIAALDRKNRTVADDLRLLDTWDRTYFDAAFGQISSDGHLVFLLEKSLPSWSAATNRAGDLPPRINGPTRVNDPMDGSANSTRLIALSLKQQGKPAWSVGGPNGDAEPRLAGVFFLGPPLPHAGRLYVLAETRGEVALCVLHAATGRLDWSLPLATPARPIAWECRRDARERQRRLAGATPSLAGNVLVCPTSAGAVVAVDPATRAILWGHQYPVEIMGCDSHDDMLWFLGRAVSAAHVRGRSVDSSVTIAAGHVLCAPVDASECFCLDLLTGELRWKHRADGLLFIGGVHERTVVVVSDHELSAWDLQSGEPVWPHRSVELPDKARPSGRGLLANEFYYLPTSAAEILKIDLRHGTIVDRLRLETPAGNLVAAAGLLISQSTDRIEAFGSREKQESSAQ